MPNFSGVWDLKDQVQAIAAGRWTGLPTLFAWGRNTAGQLGDGTAANKSSPVQVGGPSEWLEVSSGQNHVIGVSDSGELWAWGDNSPNGALGDNTVIDRSSPVQIGALTNWYRVSGGMQFTAAIKTDGTLWAWGYNTIGALGDGTAISKSSPIQVGVLTNWAQVTTSQHTAAIKTDGTLWTWGFNIFGQLGDGTTVNKSSPVQIGALTTWSQVVAGRFQCTAIKTDGTLWTWGDGAFGELGDGTVVDKSSPVQVGALTNWAKVSSSYTYTHNAAIKTDGTIWTWGRNVTGQLGDGTVIDRSSPVQVGALTNWAQVATGGNHTVSVKTDGTLWAWGSNTQGSLGDGTAANKSSPVQIGTLASWYQAAAGAFNTAALLQGSSN